MDDVCVGSSPIIPPIKNLMIMKKILKSITRFIFGKTEKEKKMDKFINNIKENKRTPVIFKRLIREEPNRLREESVEK